MRYFHLIFSDEGAESQETLGALPKIMHLVNFEAKI